jgi:phenylacetate-coenzyme A ligase PaaK-like adenylate-forming protein
MNFWNPSVECLSRDELIAREDAALDAQLQYIFAHSAFYKQKFKGIDWRVTGREVLKTLRVYGRLKTEG